AARRPGERQDDLRLLLLQPGPAARPGRFRRPRAAPGAERRAREADRALDRALPQAAAAAGATQGRLNHWIGLTLPSRTSRAERSTSWLKNLPKSAARAGIGSPPICASRVFISCVAIAFSVASSRRPSASF